MKERESNFDLLRIIATIAVVAIHVSGYYASAITTKYWLGEEYTSHMLSTSLYRVVSSFAVPVFVMLSGKFALSKSQNRNFKYYYRKEIYSIGIPILIFSAFYFLYGIVRCIAVGVIGHKSVIEIVSGGGKLIVNLIKGKPFYHLWYVYMMAGVFVLVPIIIRIRDAVGERNFNKFAIVFFVMSTLGLHTSAHELMWDPGYSFGFVGYFIIGYIISKKSDCKNNKKGIGMISLGFFVLIVLAYLLYIKGTNGIGHTDTLANWAGASSPLVAVVSVLIFAGFSKLDIKKDFSKLARLCFTIYLFHAGIWDMVSIFITRTMDNRLIIPMMSLFVFFVSWLASIIWIRLWNKIDARWNLSNQFCNILGL